MTTKTFSERKQCKHVTDCPTIYLWARVACRFLWNIDEIMLSLWSHWKSSNASTSWAPFLIVKVPEAGVAGTHIWNAKAQDWNIKLHTNALEWNESKCHHTEKPQHPDPGLGLLRQDVLSIALPTFPVEPANSQKFINSQMWLSLLKPECDNMRH